MAQLSPEEKILSLIDEDELFGLALEMGNIYSPTGQETAMMEFVRDWMQKNQFEPRLVGPFAHRANVLGRLRGKGGGLTFTFNSHMDITMGKDEVWRLREADQPVFYQAWIEGDYIYGNGVVNDKGPMAAWLAAANAIRKSGERLKGDILLAAVIGEIGHEPVDEFVGTDFIGKDFGTRYLLTHGGTADFALVAEATSFKAGWVEAGKGFFKISIYAGPSRYTPYTSHDDINTSGNAIVKAALFIPLFEEWAREYEIKNTVSFAGGTVVPKVSIGAIRGGLPYLIIRPPEVCCLYADVRLVPGTNPLDIQEELNGLLASNKIEGTAELYLHRPGFEAKQVSMLVDQLGAAHERVVGEALVHPPDHPTTSMWRDTNVYAEFGIPAVTYGPGGGGGSGINRLRLDDLLKAARVYSLTAYYLGQANRPRRA